MAKRRGNGTNGKQPRVIQLSYENPLLGQPALNDAVIQAMGEQELFELASFGKVTSGQWTGCSFGSLPMSEMRRLLKALLGGHGIDVHLIHRPAPSSGAKSRLYLKDRRLVGLAADPEETTKVENRGSPNAKHPTPTTRSHRRTSLRRGELPTDPRPAQHRFAPGERAVYARLLWLVALSLFLEEPTEPMTLASGPACLRVTMVPLSFLYTTEAIPLGMKIRSLLDIWHDELGKVLSICSTPLGPPESWRRNEVNGFSFYADPVEIVCFKPGAWMELLLQRQIARPS